MPIEWEHPTLRTEMQRRRRAKGDTLEPSNRITSCGACGYRMVPHDMLTDLRGLAPAVRAALDIPAGIDFVCDACRNGIHARGELTHAELAGALGAPAHIVERWHEHDAAFPYPGGTRAHAERKRRNPHVADVPQPGKPPRRIGPT